MAIMAERAHIHGQVEESIRNGLRVGAGMIRFD
jgi:hypothetical protein